ncbi:MAG: alpha/beta hydrolase [Ardenticatenaceae bacterium]|nr:alpha/beta hydrolase [Ardenticatenaceae bacterium]HBY96797.1 phospholipase [Chloroflexota bacterium]
MASDRLGFIHRFVPARDVGHSPTLLLLHGTGGNEDDLLPLGRQLAPEASLLSPRGKVLEQGMPRFFRRLAEGVFDVEDLIVRARELAGFVEAAAVAYGFDPHRVIAVGYSNGANIAASLLLLHPHVLAGAVLFRPMVPFEAEPLPDLSGKFVFAAAGRSDSLVRPQETERLVALLEEAGASVTLHWSAEGHTLNREEGEAARKWLAEEIAPRKDGERDR